jgi:hypothetical protein
MIFSSISEFRLKRGEKGQQRIVGLESASRRISYRAVQDACEAQGSVVFGDGSVTSTLSYVIDEDDPYRGLWRILGVDRKGKLSPQVFE